MSPMLEFLPGAYMMACLAIALFFALYWRRTRDRLFAVFALAFVLFAVERFVLVFVPADLEGRHWIFLVRLIGFVLIIAGVVDKNRPRRRARQGVPKAHARPSAEGSRLAEGTVRAPPGERGARAPL